MITRDGHIDRIPSWQGSPSLQSNYSFPAKNAYRLMYMMSVSEAASSPSIVHRQGSTDGEKGDCQDGAIHGTVGNCCRANSITCESMISRITSSYEGYMRNVAHTAPKLSTQCVQVMKARECLLSDLIVSRQANEM